MSVPNLKLVRDIMMRRVHAVTPADTLAQALYLMTTKNVRHIPVVSTNKGHVVGILSDRDLKRMIGPPKHAARFFTYEGWADKLQQKKVRSFTQRKVITIEPEALVSHAASLMSQFKIGCLPVVENKKLVGIITETDVMHDYVRLTNAYTKLAERTG